MSGGLVGEGGEGIGEGVERGRAGAPEKKASRGGEGESSRAKTQSGAVGAQRERTHWQDASGTPWRE